MMDFRILPLLLALAVGGLSPPDPYILDDTIAPTVNATSNLTPRSLAIDVTKKTLVLITFGQSQASNANPTLYVPVNSAVIDNFNINDGAAYPIAGLMQGTTGFGLIGPGNISARIADKLIPTFDRVIVATIAIGGTLISDWTTGHLSAPGVGGRFGVLMRRLAARGITPLTPGVTFAAVWMQGEADGEGGTSQAAYQASWNTLYSNMRAAGYSASSRVFIPEETWIRGVTYPAIQAAQVAIPNGTVIFSGGNLDTLDATNRQDNTHFNDAGAAAAATLIYNAMHASGAPF